MDKKLEILLGSQKNITSVNTDTYNKIELLNQTSEIMEFNINDVVNSTQVFDNERQNNPHYRIYGRIEYLSLLNGLKNTYNILEDFFTPQIDNSKNILNSFNFYLIKPSFENSYDSIDNTNDSIRKRNFTVIASKNDFEIYSAGFTNNIFGEQVYGFSFKLDFDINNCYDYLGFPITELFLYVQYIKKQSEELSQTSWSSTGTQSKITLTIKNLNIGDNVGAHNGTNINDLIEYQKEKFYQTQLEPQIFYIRTPYQDNGTKWLEWSYNPFIPFKLRYFSDELNQANTGNTSYDIVNSIPEYATKLDDNGNYVWRDINPQGYIEPLTGVGVDYPFFNKKRYLFSPIIFDIIPNLNEDSILKHQNTLDVFNEIEYSKNATNLNIIPTKDDLNNINKPC